VRLIVKRSAQLVGIAMTGLLTVGCASQQANSGYTAASLSQPIQYLPAEFSQTLSTALSGSSQFFADSPYGDQVTIEFQSPYFAASGATCRQLVVSNQASSVKLACTHNGTQWYSARSLVAGSTL
jgi:uncharacterized protein YcfL